VIGSVFFRLSLSGALEKYQYTPLFFLKNIVIAHILYVRFKYTGWEYCCGRVEMRLQLDKGLQDKFGANGS
jgi:hypothetical protein